MTVSGVVRFGMTNSGAGRREMKLTLVLADAGVKAAGKPPHSTLAVVWE